jgi:Flp pilus assembly protein TadG
MNRRAYHGSKRARFVDTLVCERGANLVEFALASAILFSLLFGVLQMCLALYTYNYISQAAREGARWAMVRGSTSCTNTPNLSNCNASSTAIQNYVQGLGYPGITSGSVTVTPTWPNGSNSPGNTVKVQVQYPFALSIPFVSLTTINMAGSSTMVISQ